MKRLSDHSRAALPALLLITLLISSAARAQTGNEVLTNDEVISMMTAGLSTTVIVNKIRTSRTRFDLSTKELIRLKQAGLNDEILMAMQGYSESSEIAGPQNTSAVNHTVESNDPNDPITRHDICIYLYTERGSEKKLTELEPVAGTEGRAAGMAGTKFTYSLW